MAEQSPLSSSSVEQQAPETAYHPRRFMVTGGAGFIGSTYVRRLLDGSSVASPTVERVVVLDKLTYAGHQESLAPVAGDARFSFAVGDIADAALVSLLLRDEKIDTIVNFAAETHVDRSLTDPGSFITTDVFGVYVLLEAVRTAGTVGRFLHVSTDEVYGHVVSGDSREGDGLAPRSPYSASKAGGEMMVGAYVASWGVPALITRGSNTYGPYQYPEKLIPLFVTNALQDLPLPVYGDGAQIRDWLYVDDHCAGIDWVLSQGILGESYNVGGGQSRTNLQVTEAILAALGKSQTLIQHVQDRPGHDRRYSLDTTKLRRLGWTPQVTFEEGIVRTVSWYVNQQAWWRARRNAEFQSYYQRQYDQRPVQAAPLSSPGGGTR